MVEESVREYNSMEWDNNNPHVPPSLPCSHHYDLKRLLPRQDWKMSLKFAQRKKGLGVECGKGLHCGSSFVNFTFKGASLS